MRVMVAVPDVVGTAKNPLAVTSAVATAVVVCGAVQSLGTSTLTLAPSDISPIAV